MAINQENLMSAGKAGVEAGIAIAQAQFAAMERLAALNMNTAKATFADASEHVRSVLNARDPQEFGKLNSAAAQPAVQGAVAYAKSVYDVATQAQANVVKIVEAQGTDLNRAFASTIDAMAKNAPAGSDAAINAFKSTFAAFNFAYDGWSKIAKQTVEAAESNFDSKMKTVSKSR